MYVCVVNRFLYPFLDGYIYIYIYMCMHIFWGSELKFSAYIGGKSYIKMSIPICRWIYVHLSLYVYAYIGIGGSDLEFSAYISWKSYL